MKEYDLYVPLRSNRGARVSPARLKWLKKLLIRRFGGLTHFPQCNLGVWKLGAVTFQDEIVILRVLASADRQSKKFWIALKEELKRRWRQQEILIVARDITTV